MKTTIKLISGKYFKPVTLESLDNENIKVTFGFDKNIIAEIKQLEGARWNPEKHYWTIKKTQHNSFALSYLSGQNPYQQWEKQLIEYESKRELRSYQLDGVRRGITYKQELFAWEMGTGKSLAAIEIMEYFGYKDAIWVGPKSALQAAELELMKWNSKIWPRFFSYDSIKKYVQNDFEVPHLIIFDEIQKCRNPTTQRAISAQFIADKMREKYKKDSIIIGMSGTPAPFAPTDWWSLIRIIRPGWLKEGNRYKFQQRLGLVVQKESPVGGVYPELVVWWDDEQKCKICGSYKDDIVHSIDMSHEWVPSVNEVKFLYERLKGITVIQRKKDCLKELPDKIFRIIKCEPSESILRAAKLILANAKSVITANILLRELSDGFQYKEIEIGLEICKGCKGKKSIISPILIEWKCSNCDIIGDGEFINCPKCENPLQEENKIYEQKEIDCPYCEGSGETLKTERQAVQILDCPKDQLLIDSLDEHEEIGRCVVYAGFTGSVDRCVDICKKQKWNVIRIDGRGWQASWTNDIKPINMLQEFQRIGRIGLEKIIIVGQPESAGIGLNLTASPTANYFSNSFKPEARDQSCDRIHRIGMDLCKGATINDFIHLPSDLKVLETLKMRKRLQDMSLGAFQECYKNI